MTTRTDSGILDQYGLGMGQVLNWRHDSRTTSADVSIMMRNDVRFSNAAAPSIPVARGRLELIRVQVQGHILTIADIWGECVDSNSNVVETTGARLYGLLTVSLQGASVFMLLSELPAGTEDAKFFPSSGSVVLFDDLNNGPRVLRACGFDDNTGSAQGWIFDAIET